MNKEGSRERLALNMMTEAKAGFRAFNFGPKNDREVDLVKLRQLLAEGHEWNDEMHRKISPQFKSLPNPSEGGAYVEAQKKNN